jgi:cell wall-active antibiotic response 4TMS protein YvqF
MEQPVRVQLPYSQVVKPRVEFPVWGVILVMVGALFLTAQAGHIHLWTFLLRWWPLILIAVGATHMVNERRVLSPGITAVLMGGFMLFFTLGALKWKMFLRIWPIVLVAVGASMLIGARRRP